MCLAPTRSRLPGTRPVPRDCRFPRQSPAFRFLRRSGSSFAGGANSANFPQCRRSARQPAGRIRGVSLRAAAAPASLPPRLKRATATPSSRSRPPSARAGAASFTAPDGTAITRRFASGRSSQNTLGQFQEFARGDLGRTATLTQDEFFARRRHTCSMPRIRRRWRSRAATRPGIVGRSGSFPRPGGRASSSRTS